jgi:hypothetical protein
MEPELDLFDEEVWKCWLDNQNSKSLKITLESSTLKNLLFENYKLKQILIDNGLAIKIFDLL